MTIAASELVFLLTPKRTWLQFRLRTLFVLVLLVAVPSGLFRWKIARKREAVAKIEGLGGIVSYDWQRAGMNEPPGAAWLRKLLGDDVLADVVCVKLPPRQRVFYGERTKLMFRLSSSDYDPGVRDDDLRLLAIFANLEDLDLARAEIGDAGLAHLRRLASLRSLNLDHTKLTDSGVAQLKKVTGLQSLCLSRTALTDASLIHLKGLGGLDLLDLRCTGVTKAGVAELQNALPKCKIIR
jgi:hypothetical protein